GEHIDGLALDAVERDDAVSGQRPPDIGQRRQVAARPDRAALWDERHDVVVEEVEHTLDELDAHARVALRQAVGAQEHRHAGDLGRGDRTGADAHEPEDVLLQPGRLARGDLAVRAVAETGRNPVDRYLLGDQLILEPLARADGPGSTLGQLNCATTP